ncbi:hypothetical protein GCM10008967_42000 [Bacillus carboniphilus]|uniref:Permease n=1 Tax=Bacillus carboniphilus TaxID=86663 RepID=A0ABP3GMZ8_9BACI
MYPTMIKGIAALLSAYMFILLLPTPSPFTLENFLAECILDPLGFLAAMFSFLIAFLCLGSLIQSSFHFIASKGKRKNYRELFLQVIWILSILLLIHLGTWHVLLLYCFAIFYGMMSLKDKTVNGG